MISKYPTLHSTRWLPAVLTAMVLAIGAVFAIFFDWKEVVLYVAILPVPLLLLWLSSSVPSPQARIAACDAAHRHLGGLS